MFRRLRDLAATVVVLIVLFGMLVLINPRMREQAGQFTGDVQTQEWSSSGGPVGAAALAVFTVTSDFALDNPFMFAFAVVACVLFVLMLRT